MDERRNGAAKPSLSVSGTDVGDVNARGLRRVLMLAFGSPSDSVDIHDPDEAGRLLREICTRQADSANILLELAAAPGTPLEDLRFIKELAKRLLKAANSSREAEAARLLFHVAVAAALGRFHIDMSSRPIADRILLYERLAIVFSGHQVGDVFRCAADGIRQPPVRSSRKRKKSDVEAR